MLPHSAFCKKMYDHKIKKITIVKVLVCAEEDKHVFLENISVTQRI